MRHAIAIICLFCACGAGGTEKWQTFLSYHNATRVEPQGTLLYTLAQGALFVYDTDDAAIYLYNKQNALNDGRIAQIARRPDGATLVIAYENGNIDLMEPNGDVYNLPDFKNKQTTYGKEINNISFLGGCAYLATQNGIMVIDLDKKEIANTYPLNRPVTAACAYGDKIYAATDDGLYTADTNRNLLDPATWEWQSVERYRQIVAYDDRIIAITDMEICLVDKQTNQHSTIRKESCNFMNAYNGKLLAGNENTVIVFDAHDRHRKIELDLRRGNLRHIAYARNTFWACYGYHGLIGQKLNEETGRLEDITHPIVPESPVRNLADRMRFANRRLLVAGGSLNYYGVENQGTLMALDQTTWINFEEDGIEEATKLPYMNMTALAQDPRDPAHHYATSARHGLYEFRDYAFVKLHTLGNSGLESIFVDNPHYVSTDGPVFDGHNNLWMVNNGTDKIVKILRADGTWLAFDHPEIAKIETFQHIVFDKRGWMWANSMWYNDNNDKPGFFCFDYNNTLENIGDDRTRFVQNINNQDGATVTIVHCYCIAEDSNGAVWIGTDQGPIVLHNPENIFKADATCTQIKVPRNDGTHTADYLLADQHVIAIAIDGANRKWIGTRNTGIYLLSDDGKTTILHFHADNSPLTSNSIQSIAIDPKTGEVFIGTDKAIHAYKADATEPAAEMPRNIHAYPNPVTRGYTGVVTVDGLTDGADVKIVDAAGTLVHRATSNGGRITWDIRNTAGNRVATGVYYILATDADGRPTVATKLIVISSN